MSAYNEMANDPAIAERVRAWLRTECPVIVLYGPSGVGKTTMCGDLFRPSPIRSALLPGPARLIDADNSEMVIAEYTQDPRVCTRRAFDQGPDQAYPWMMSELAAAATSNDAAIVIEGFTSIYSSVLAGEKRKNPLALGHALQRMYIPASGAVQVLGEEVKRLKQARMKRGAGGPIIVTLNTKECKDSDDQNLVWHEPDWSGNSSERFM